MADKENCLTGECPPAKDIADGNLVKLSEGSGGKEMHKLVSEIRKCFFSDSAWRNTDEDSASMKFAHGNLLFTTDSYVVTPLFFPGGNIGKLAFCGTVNDLVVMGAKPLGISLGLVIEEGFSKHELFEIMRSIGKLSEMYNIPVVTGDTKVMDKGSVDRIIINTSGIGFAENILDKPCESGDKIIVSGGIGEHGTVLIAKRFEIETSLETDCKPLIEEMMAIKDLVKKAKDITRGGMASVLNEIAQKDSVQIFIQEESIPIKQEARALTEILGIDIYSLACEGRFVCVASNDNALEVVRILKGFNCLAEIIGEVKEGKGVVVQTRFGKMVLGMPSGNIVPRIC